MSIFVGPSIWRQINVRTMTSMMTAIMNNPYTDKIIWAPIWNDALIGRSRSIMCTEFMKTDADVMVIIDDDIVFESGDFWKIVEGARETRGIYGGAYVTRSTTPHISSRALPGTGEQIFAPTPQRRPVEYQYLATGFFAIHRDVLEAMSDAEFVDAYGTHKIETVELGADRPFMPYFSPFVGREDDGRLHYLSEDWAFCNRARQKGITVWADLSIILQHMGEYPYTVADMKTLAEPGLPSTGIDTMVAESTLEITGNPILDNIIEDIAGFTDDEPGDVRRMLPAATDALFKLWLSRTETEAEWYKREDVGYHYICDLANWHQQGGGVLPDDWVKSMAGKRVLDFGAGNGQLSLRLAQAGANVMAVETNPVLRDFTAYRARKHGIHGIVVTPHLPVVERFDAVIAWHVLEHVEEPVSVLDSLLGLLTPDGVFISQSGFQEASTPMHHIRDDWDAVLESRGLVGSTELLDTDGNPWAFSRVAVMV